MTESILIITAIVSSICAVMGVIISYFSLKKKINHEVNNLNTMISMKNNSQGNTYQNCQFYDSVKSEQSINSLQENGK